VAEQTVEGVRNAEDGKAAGFGKPDVKTLLVDTAKRDSQPHGRCFERQRPEADLGRKTLKRRTFTRG